MKYTPLWLLLINLVTFAQSADEMLFMQAMKTPKGKTKAETLIALAKSKIDTPYQSGTLEINTKETLVCNLRALDCWTFVENMVALTETKYSSKPSYGLFQEQLQMLRYRNGKINGYHSRLHYFVEWLVQSTENEVLKNITKEISGQKMVKDINFMTKNRKLYPKLKDELIFEKIVDAEENLNQHTFYYIPKEKVASIENKIKEGDLIAITSTIAGLDCNHEGFAIKQNGRIYLLHASADFKKVMISPEPLADYLQKIKKHSGIMVLRY